jgi:YcxB-like protein
VNEITIKAEMTPGEYYACGNAWYRKGERIVIWTVVAIGAASLATSAALTWGSPASILAGVALIAFSFIYFWSGQISASRRRRGYKRFMDSDVSYTFTQERIVAKWRDGQSSFAWTAVDRVMELRTLYLLILGDRYICVPKRDIPPHNLGDFIELLRTHGLKRVGMPAERLT